MDPAPQAAHSSAMEPNTGLTSEEACDSGPPDSHPDVGSGPRTPEPVEPGCAPAMEFTIADIFQHSPFGDVLNSLRSLSLCQEIPGRTMFGSSGKQATKKFVTHPPPTS